MWRRCCPLASCCNHSLPPSPILAQVDGHYDKLRNIGEYIEDTEVGWAGTVGWTQGRLGVIGWVACKHQRVL